MDGIEYDADQNHAATLGKKNVTCKDRPVSTPGEDTNDKVNEPELSEPAEIKSFRATWTSQHYSSVQRNHREPCQDQRRRANATSSEWRDTWRTLRTKESSKDSSSRCWTPPSQCTRTQTGQVADPAGRARQVEWYRPTLGVVKHWSSTEVGGVVIVLHRGARHEQGEQQSSWESGGWPQILESRSTSWSEQTQVQRWEVSTGVASERRATSTRRSCGCMMQCEIEYWRCRRLPARRT